jgi:hypothetical protein
MLDVIFRVHVEDLLTLQLIFWPYRASPRCSSALQLFPAILFLKLQNSMFFVLVILAYINWYSENKLNHFL